MRCVATRQSVVAVLLVALGCKSGPELVFDRAASEAWRKQMNEEMRAALSPISAIDGHYFSGESALRIGLVDGVPAADPPPGVPTVVLRAVPNAVECIEGCDAQYAKMTEPTAVPLGRHKLMVAPQPLGDQGPTGRVVVHDPQAQALLEFEGLPFFAIHESHFVAATFEPAKEKHSTQLATTRGLIKPLEVAGTLRLRLGGHEYVLVAHDAGPNDHGGRALFIMFTDETTGESTYPVGRYLEAQTAVGAQTVGLDFNRAHNPWCAYSPHYNCPVPPAGNKIAVAIDAGERKPDEH